VSLGASVEIVLGGGGVGTLAALVQGVAVLVRVSTTGDTLYAVGSTRKFDKDCRHDNVLFSVALSTTSTGCCKPLSPPVPSKDCKYLFQFCL
jgi:hypothetical protein